jgi:hypothetical protein
VIYATGRGIITGFKSAVLGYVRVSGEANIELVDVFEEHILLRLERCWLNENGQNWCSVGKHLQRIE